MPIYCCVPCCTSNSGLEPNLKFYTFPKNGNSEKWLKAIEEGTGLKLADETRLKRVCEKHFKSEDFVPNKQINGAILMIRKSHAIPSVFKDANSINRKPTVFKKPGKSPGTIPMSETDEALHEEQKILLTIEKDKMIIDAETRLKCRICLKNRGVVYFKECLRQSTVTVMEAMKKTFNMEFNPDLQFPRKLCTRCFDYLTTSHWLKSEALKSEVTLMDMKKNPDKYKEVPQITTITASEENAFFTIKEIPEGEALKGWQETFTEPVPVDKIKEEPEELIENETRNGICWLPEENLNRQNVEKLADEGSTNGQTEERNLENQRISQRTRRRSRTKNDEKSDDETQEKGFYYEATSSDEETAENSNQRKPSRNNRKRKRNS